jgi:hypothetical protein
VCEIGVIGELKRLMFDFAVNALQEEGTVRWGKVKKAHAYNALLGAFQPRPNR